MEKLLEYLKSLVDEDRDKFFSTLQEETGTGFKYTTIRKYKSANQLLPPAVCSFVETKSFAPVTRKDLRPDDWHLIWPELIDQEGAA